ncbi:amidase [Tsuneonella mangrovi]|uniref:amidase n=1 Tax=Tsuneonella mangrovi TaxID=1982042 RepID=UPI001F0A6CF5|nr:amidase [Tsuneonella mangrovi]
MRTLPIALAALAIPAAAAASPGSDAQAYLDRIKALDGTIHSVIVTNPDAPAEADAAAKARLPLGGRTVLVKDNIETREWATTAGSLALKDNFTKRDAPLIARLRKDGGVVLGKTNLSEWANMRSSHSTSGWSGVGGLTRNPHATDRTACGSSSGSGAAVAANFSWAAIGTETDGSVTCPSSVNGIVGLKPTVGLVSRTGVVPISHSQDTPGPMARSVYDAALLLNAISGTDPADPATADADAHKTDFTAGLSTYSLKGVRIGVMRKQIGNDKRVAALFQQAMDNLKAAGAVLVDIDYDMPDDSHASGFDEMTVLLYELREDLGKYLTSSPADIPIRSLADAIAFNKAHADKEMPWFGQDLFEKAEETTDKAAYETARANDVRITGPEGIDKLLADNKVAFLVAPTVGPAWTIDLVNGGNYNGSIGIGTLPAVSGYPHLTVPMGAVKGLPVGLSFVGAKWSDHKLLEAGAAYERVRTAVLPEPTFAPWKADPDS